MAHLPAVMMRIPMCCQNQDRVISPGPCGSPSRDARADRSWAAIRHLRTRGSRYPASGGSCLNGGIPAEVIVSPLKEIQRCLFVNSMHLRETGHGSLLPVDQAGAIRVDSLCRRRLRTRLSPIINVYAHLTAPSREYDTDRPGGDYHSFDLTTNDPGLCAAQCAAVAASPVDGMATLEG